MGDYEAPTTTINTGGNVIGVIVRYMDGCDRGARKARGPGRPSRGDVGNGRWKSIGSGAFGGAERGFGGRFWRGGCFSGCERGRRRVLL